MVQNDGCASLGPHHFLLFETRPEYRWLALNEIHCEAYVLLAILCIEGNQRHYRGEETPPVEGDADLL